MAYNMKRSSGLDFSDGAPALDAHPDLTLNMGNPNLQRNKTERMRMQGLMRIPTMRNGAVTNAAVENKQLTLKERWDLWMVNEGGRRMFFYIFVLLFTIFFLSWESDSDAK